MLGLINVFYKTPSCANYDLSLVSVDASGVNNKNKQVISETAATQIPITATTTCTGLVYSLIITPTPATSFLIALDSTSAPTKIIFAATNDPNDAKVYSITLSVNFSGQTPTKTSGPFTFEYILPCPSAIIVTSNHPKIATSVLVTAWSSTQLWYATFPNSAAK